MEPGTLNTLLTGVFTLTGVAITAIVGLFGYYLKTRNDLAKEMLSRRFTHRVEIYERAVECITSIIYRTSPAPSVEDIRGIYTRLLLVGSPEVLRAFSMVLNASASKLRSGGLSESEIRAKQAEVAREFFNAVRVDLYPDQQYLNPKDIGFIEPNSNIS